MADPELFDVDEALRHLAQCRQRRDQGSVAAAEIGDHLANHLRQYFGPEALETVGRALVIAGASAAGLASRGVSAEAVMNVLMFSGQRLVGDAIAADGEVARG